MLCESVLEVSLPLSNTEEVLLSLNPKIDTLSHYLNSKDHLFNEMGTSLVVFTDVMIRLCNAELGEKELR